MAVFPRLEPGWRRLNDDFAWAPVYPPDPAEGDAALPMAPYGFPFEVLILVCYKSNTDTGRAAHNHLLGVLQGEDRALRGLEVDRTMLLPLALDGFRFMLLHTNAEVPANPKHKAAVLGVNTIDSSIAGFDYKQLDKRCDPTRSEILDPNCV
jgi:hypothetical protein